MKSCLAACLTVLVFAAATGVASAATRIDHSVRQATYEVVETMGFPTRSGIGPAQQSLAPTHEDPTKLAASRPYKKRFRITAPKKTRNVLRRKGRNALTTHNPSTTGLNCHTVNGHLVCTSDVKTSH